MNRIDRLHAILTHLQSKRKITAQEIADRFQISLRTVYRDIKALDESGVPVIGEAGTGYTIMEGYRLPPVMFTQEEAVSLMLGAKFAAQFTDKSMQQQYDSALFKIKAVLRSTDKDHVDSLADHIAIFSNHQPVPAGSAQYLAALQKAIVDRKKIFIRYQPLYKEELTERQVEPIGLCYYGSTWHLISWCCLRAAYRDFRLDCIKALHVKEEEFNPAHHPSLQEYIRKMTTDHHTGLHEVSVLFKADVVRFIGQQRYYHGFVSEEKIGQDYRMKFVTAHLEGLARWLLLFTDKVSIETPAALKETMKSHIDCLYRHYQK